jgi:hypothetical protein
MADVLDPALYVHAPRADLPSSLALAHALLSALPSGASDGVRKAAARIRHQAAAVQGLWRERHKADAEGGASINVRPFDQRLDVAWRALDRRLEGYALLASTGLESARRAAELRSLLFPTGLMFLTLPFAAEWAESQKRLDLIAEQHLAADLDRLAGPELLAEVRAAHTEYGKALHITQAEPARADPAPLLEPLRALQQTFVDYAVQVLAATDLADAESVGRARAALRPLDVFREAAARRAGGAAPVDELPPVTPTTALPPVHP